MSYAIDTCIVDYLAACGPADESDIYRECRIQVTPDKVSRQAVRDTTERLMLTGSIEIYDDMQGVYDIATGEL